MMTFDWWKKFAMSLRPKNCRMKAKSYAEIKRCMSISVQNINCTFVFSCLRVQVGEQEVQ